MERTRRRVVVTGLGVVSPLGIGVGPFWEGLCAGRDGTGPIRAFDTTGFDRNRGGEVRDFEPEAFLRRLEPSRVARTTQFAIAAARMAADQAGFPRGMPQGAGVCFGTTMGNQSAVEEANDRWLAGGEVDGAEAARFPPVLIARQVALELGCRGPVLVLPTACAAGNYAIGWGRDLIVSGRAEVVIAGGSDALSRGCYAVFNRLSAIAQDVCRPFDRDRSGMLVSEGAGALVLESLEHCRAREAAPLAELLGYGLSCDAFHPTAPHPEGAGAALAMRRALAGAGKAPDEVSYINAHGTGTRANDLTESKAIREVFGTRADQIPVSSIKSMLGHTMGAASAIEAVASVLAILTGTLPPTAHFREPDPECVTNVVPNRALAFKPKLVLSNSFGFGGNVSTLALGEPPE